MKNIEHRIITQLNHQVRCQIRRQVNDHKFITKLVIKFGSKLKRLSHEKH
jgi:hypothetical protein